MTIYNNFSTKLPRFMVTSRKLPLILIAQQVYAHFNIFFFKSSLPSNVANIIFIAKL